MNKRIGWIDRVEGGVIDGWCISADSELLPATVNIFIDTILVGSGIASHFRADLEKQSLQNGYAAFHFTVPDVYCDGRSHTVMAERDFDSAALENRLEFRHYRLSSNLRVQKFVDSVIERVNIKTQAILSEIALKKRVALYVTYSTAFVFDTQQMRIWQWLDANGFCVVLIHASGLDTPTQFVCPNNLHLIIKRNVGYDFGSWICGIEWLRRYRGGLAGIDQMVLINDSIYGPLVDGLEFTSRIFDMRAQDLVGVVDSYQRRYHIQSFLVSLNRNALEADLLSKFLHTYSFSSNKDVVIEEAELGLSKIAMDLGLSLGAVYPYDLLCDKWIAKYTDDLALTSSLCGDGWGNGGKRALDRKRDWLVETYDNITLGVPLNPSHHFFDILLDEGYPFIKREVITKNIIEHPYLYERTRELRGVVGVRGKECRLSAQQFGTSRVIYI